MSAIPDTGPYKRFTFASARIRREDAARAISRMYECSGKDPVVTREIARVLFEPLAPPPKPPRYRPGRQSRSQGHE